MANVNKPFGLRPLMVNLGGGPPVIEHFDKDASEAAAIFIGDAVNREADGNIEANGATPGTTLYTGVSLNYGAAATLTKHAVIISPDAVFVAQTNGTWAEADGGLNANLSLGAGSALTQMSGHTINISSKASDAALDMKLLRRLPDDSNEIGDYTRVVVVFNKHRYAPGVAGV